MGEQDIFLVAPTPCRAGYYCPGGGIPQACPAGTFNPTPGSSLSSACQNCTANMYCGVGASAPSGCPAGTYMHGGVCVTCPVGSYCNSLSPLPVPCGAGTYGAATGGQDSAACTPCPAGSFCNTTGLSAGFRCDAGFYSATPGSRRGAAMVTLRGGQLCDCGM